MKDDGLILILNAEKRGTELDQWTNPDVRGHWQRTTVHDQEPVRENKKKDRHFQGHKDI